MPSSIYNITNDPLLQKLFQAPVSNIVNKGSLVSFNYSFWMHDPYPLVIISDYLPGIRIRGVNLHYLTYPTISSMLGTACENRGFSYMNIKGDEYIRKAFRNYRWNGIRQVKKLDCKSLLQIMAAVRSIDPSQIKAIRQSIEQQLQRMTNPVVDQEPENLNKSNTITTVPTVPSTKVIGA